MTPRLHPTPEMLQYQQDQFKEAVNTQSRNAAIESFIGDPSYGQPAGRPSSDYGAREFSFDGQPVYTWSADQARKDSEDAHKVDEGRTFAELLTTDLPSRVAVATRLWSNAGDQVGAEAELGAVDKFVRDNRDTLRTLAKYQGTNDMAHKVSVQAMSYLSGEYRLPFSAMAADPEIRAKTASHMAQELGLGPTVGGIMQQSATGDVRATAVLDQLGLGAPVPAPTPNAVGKGATPQAAKAAAHGIADPAYAEAYASFDQAAFGKLSQELPPDTLQLLGPTGTAKLTKTLFDLGGATVGSAALDTGLQIVKSSKAQTPQERADLLQSSVQAYSELVKASGDSDPVSLSLDAKAISGIQAAMPRGSSIATNKMVAVNTMRTFAGVKDMIGEAGKELTGDRASLIASALTKRATSQSSLLPEESAVLKTVDSFSQLKSGITADVNPLLPRITEKEAAGKPPEVVGSLGYSVGQNFMTRALAAGASQSFVTGKPLAECVDSEAHTLGDFFVSMGGQSREDSDLAARASMRILFRNKKFNMADIDGEISRAPDLLKEVKREADSQTGANAPAGAPLPPVTADGKTNLERTLDRVSAKTGGTGSEDYKAASAITGLADYLKNEGHGPTTRGYSDALSKLVNPGGGVGDWARKLTDPATSAAWKYILASDSAKVKDSKLEDDAVASYMAQAKAAGSALIFNSVGSENTERMARAFVGIQLGKLRGLIREPASGVSIGELAKRYVKPGEWDASDIPRVTAEATPVNTGMTASFSYPAEGKTVNDRERVLTVDKSTGKYDFAKTAAYMFLSRALGGEEPGLRDYVAFDAKVAALEASGLPLMAGAALNVAAHTVFDFVAPEKVPVNDAAVPRRLKSYLLSQFELPEARESDNQTAGSPVADTSRFTPKAVSDMRASNEDAGMFPILKIDDPGSALRAKAAMQNTSVRLNKPLEDEVVRKFITEGVYTRYGGSNGGLRREYLNDLAAQAFQDYVPGQSPREVYAHANELYKTRVSAQKEAMTKEAAEMSELRAKASAKGRLEAAGSGAPFVTPLANAGADTEQQTQ